MRLTRIELANYSRLRDLDIELRGHLVIVGANDVGKTSLLRILNLLLGPTSYLYQGLSIDDLQDPATRLVATATFAEFSKDEQAVFFREIDVAEVGRSVTLRVRMEVSADPDDVESVVVTRWCPGREEVRGLTREQLKAIGWRYVPALRSASAAQLDGPNGAVQVLLRAVESELGDEKTALGTLMEAFNELLGTSNALATLRQGMADHLSGSMPRTIAADDLSIRTSAQPGESVLDNVSMYFTRDGGFVPLSEQSDGIRQLISMTLFDLAEGAANVIAIDEPELHLHPSSQRTVAELLTRTVNQKILVTHSPYIVQKFEPAQVVVIGPDRTCHQIAPSLLSVEERGLAHWWSPRMLEALTAKFAILVEGIADRLIVEAAAKARGLSLDRIGAVVFELGGAENFPAVYKLLGPSGFGVTVLGLVDTAESPKWVGAVGGRPKDVVGRDIFISTVDLEEEYCRGLGAEEVARRLIDAKIVQESGVLSSCGVSDLSHVGAAELAAFCRSSSKSANRKVPAALTIARTMSPEDARKIDSVARLLTQLDSRSTT